MLPEGFIGTLKRSDPEDLQAILSAVQERHPASFGSAARELINPAAKEGHRPFARGLIRASEVPAGQTPVRMWFGLYPSTVVMIIGETGAGKSTLFYNLCVHASRNEPLWDIPFGLLRPLRVLYVDPENSGNWEENQGGQCARKLDRIDQGRPVDLLFHDGRGLNLSDPQCLSEITDAIRQNEIDLCLLDPIANLFNTVDENDNAEASRQMRTMTSLSRETGACIVCCHHTGKDATGNYGRGASARLAAADVGIVFRARGNQDESDDDYRGEPEDRTDVCRLQIVKNRIEGRGSLFLRMAGDDRFDRVGFQEWKTAAKTTDGTPRANQAESEIRILLAAGEWTGRDAIVAALKLEGIGRDSADSALKSLVEAQVICCKRVAKGALYYNLPSFVTAVDTPYLVSWFPDSLRESRKPGNCNNAQNGCSNGHAEDWPDRLP